jgi:hypothetical protein
MVQSHGETVQDVMGESLGLHTRQLWSWFVVPLGRFLLPVKGPIGHSEQ